MTFACSTTHDLGRASDPGTFVELEKVTARSDAYAHVEPLPGVPPRLPGQLVRRLVRAGVVVGPTASAAPGLVPFARVRSISTYDHLRGTRDGALALGLPALVVGGVLGALLYNLGSNCSDGCGRRDDPVLLVGGLGGLFGLCGAVFGAGLGALAGHEDRYVITPE